MSGPIERYLAELERILPRLPLLKRRILSEVEDHLREASAREGEERALERFGAPHAVAAGFAATYAARYARLAQVATLGALASAFLALYPVPENALPPAPWPEGAMPEHLAWKQSALGAVFVAAITLTAVALLAARRHPRLASAATALALGLLTAFAGLATVLAVQWTDAVPGTPGWLTFVPLASLAPVALAAVLLAPALRLPREPVQSRR